MTHPTLSWCRRPVLQKYQPRSRPQLLLFRKVLIRFMVCSHAHTCTHTDTQYDEDSVNLKACVKRLAVFTVKHRENKTSSLIVLFSLKYTQVVLLLDLFHLSLILQSTPFFCWCPRTLLGLAEFDVKTFGNRIVFVNNYKLKSKSIHPYTSKNPD